METGSTTESPAAPELAARFEAALNELAAAEPFAKTAHAGKVLQMAGRLLCMPDGPEFLFEQAPALDQAGI
ncbi:MAG: hypothetical protein PVI37_04305, partial [Gammaproteobacteria bacterium]